jgi:imidazolonepropionase-like amidohydrolase
MERDIGTVEPGKLADLIVIEGNPLRDLRVFQNLDSVRLIMKGGQVYKRTL